MKTVNRSLIFVIGIVVVCSFFITCNKDEPKLEGINYSISDIAGNWTATEATFSSLGNPYKGGIDIIQEGGSLKLGIQNNGRFTFTIILPGEADQITTGQLGFDEEWLAVSYDDDPGEYDYLFFDLNDDKSILTISGEGGYDYDEDGEEDHSIMSFILNRD